MRADKEETVSRSHGSARPKHASPSNAERKKGDPHEGKERSRSSRENDRKTADSSKGKKWTSRVGEPTREREKSDSHSDRKPPRKSLDTEVEKDHASRLPAKGVGKPSGTHVEKPSEMSVQSVSETDVENPESEGTPTSDKYLIGKRGDVFDQLSVNRKPADITEEERLLGTDEVDIDDHIKYGFPYYGELYFASLVRHACIHVKCFFLL